MVEQKDWKEFKETGLLWFINQTLHVFGWALVYEYIDGEITSVYPARVKFRGFAESINTDGYKKVSEFLRENSNELAKEANE